MSKLQYRKKKEIIPLLVHFKKPIRLPDANYSYDESMELNITAYDSEYIPIVLIPGSLATIKTLSKVFDED